MTNKEQIAEQAKTEIESINDPVEQLNIIHEAIKKIDSEFTEMSQEFKKEIYELSRILYDLIRWNDYKNELTVYSLRYFGGELYAWPNWWSVWWWKKAEFVPHLLEIEALLRQFSNLLHDWELQNNDLIYEHIDPSQRDERDEYLKMLAEQIKNNTLKVYPNPTSDTLNIVLDNSVVSPQRYHTNVNFETIVTWQGTNPDWSSRITTSTQLGGHDRPFNPLGWLQTVETDNTPPYNAESQNLTAEQGISVYDIQWKRHLLQSKINKDEQWDYNCAVNVQSLPSGTYFIRIPATTAWWSQATYITQKFVKI